jgi:large subunit ribosomal protein L23
MSILKRPLLTEKTNLGAEKGIYGFVVDLKANKIQIKKAVEKAYGVSVTEVRTMRYGGKPKSRYTRAGVLSGTTAAFKKAIVTLAEGEFIDFYEGL